MGRKRIDRRARAAIEAIAEAWENPRFRERLSILVATLRTHEAHRLEAREKGDPCAAFADWRWREVDPGEGRARYSGPYYDLRELCDDFGLPWPHSGKILLRMLSGRPAKPLDSPEAIAWRAWRMARTGLGRPRENEIEEAKGLLGPYTVHGRKRNFDRGLTQEAVARILWADQRTVRKWVSDCRRYAKAASINEIARAASLSRGELFSMIVTRMMQEKPEE